MISVQRRFLQTCRPDGEFANRMILTQFPIAD